jgi:hypothetical protein
MRLTGQWIEDIINALLSAFTSRDDLRKMIRIQMDEHLDEIANGNTLRILAFNLVDWAEQKGRVGDLVTSALNENPGNPDLQELAKRFEQWQRASQPPPNITSASTPQTQEGYRYDVFISYKRDKMIVSWLLEVVTRIRYWLTEELGGRAPKVFFETDTLEDGNRWPDKLREAAQTSRCMVGIWSAAYFQSHWCVSELQSFSQREILAGIRRGGLMMPIKYGDGIWFPPEVSDIPLFDLSKYTSTLESFWKTERAVQLEEEMKVFSQQLAQVIERAPGYRHNWPIVEGKPATPKRQGLERL